jgi:hypothetical protein
MTKITFETVQSKADYRICVAKPGIYKSSMDELVIVTSHNMTTYESGGGEQKVYGLLSDGGMITNDHFHVFPVVEIKATVIDLDS